MKLFRQLLVAPAALGLMAPMAATAADLNLEGVSEYSASGEQVTSISQFSDVQPSDWAYQALTGLVERYGCVSGTAGSSFDGNRAMTRYEAAALLNSCLDSVTEVSDSERRLLKEFAPELATIRGRVDGLEAKVGEMGATQFSTTTKLSGVATFVVGANSYGGNGTLTKNAEAASGGTTFNYDYKLDLDTSFDGSDLLKARLRSGNFENGAFNGTHVGLATIENAYDSGDAVKVDRLWYQFPLGEMTATVGPKVRQDDMLAVWPAAYPADTILDFFTYAGAPGTYNLTTGGGAGLSWAGENVSISGMYVSNNADNSDPDDGGGLFTDAAGSNATLQVAYAEEAWGLAAAYNYASSDNNSVGLLGSNGTPLANAVQAMGPTNSFALSAWWSPDEVGMMPSISAGFGFNSHDDDNDTNATYDSATTSSWYVGLQWADAFVTGNTLGAAIGQAAHVTDVDRDGTASNSVDDENLALELFYQIQVSDNVSVTPAIFYLDDPTGDSTDSDFSNLGGLIKTTFSF